VGWVFGLKLVTIQAFDIPDAWYQCLARIFSEGYVYVVDEGSFPGHKRLEFDNVAITISNPSNRPLIPEVPEGIPPPTDMKYVNYYTLRYLLSDFREEGEEYTYGERIFPQLEILVEKLRRAPNTNQACIEVARPEDIHLKHPPCLRLIDMRIRYGKLHFYVYFRSWDLYSGFPPNLAGLQLLKEHLAEQIGVEDGTLNAYSKGLHLYDFQWEHVKALLSRGSSPSLPFRKGH